MAGTSSASCIYSGDKVVYRISFTADSDGLTHSLSPVKGYYLYTAHVIPGSGASSFGLTIIDSDGYDILGGAGSGMSGSSASTVTPSPAYPVCEKSSTVTISSTYGNGVTGVIELTFVP